MKVCVTGGRTYGNKTVVYSILNEYKDKIDLIGVGDASGADMLVRNWCRDNNVKFRTFVADWKQFGDSAGPIRNKTMIDSIKPDILFVFPGGAGTTNTREYTEEKYPNTEIIVVND